MSLVEDQVTGQGPDRVGAEATPVDHRIDVDVDAGVPVVRIGLLAPLHRARPPVLRVRR